MKDKGIFGLTGMSLGLGLTGEAIGGDIGTKLGQAGQTSASFISPAINISMSGHLIKQLKDLK